MRFTRIILDNWRNFGHVDVTLENRAFLVGPNASGKSNFLDAFRFLRDLVLPGGGFISAVNTRGGIVRLRNLAARRYSDVIIEAQLFDDKTSTHWRYRVEFNQDTQKIPILKEEEVWQDHYCWLKRPDSKDDQDQQRLRQTHLEQTFANRDFRAIADFFSSIHYFHLVPQLVRDPERSVARIDDPFGGDFLEQIAKTPKNVRDARLRRIANVLRVAVPQLMSLRLQSDERGSPHLEGKYEHWRPQGAWQSESDFSDGTLRLVGLLWSLLHGDGPLLLEEPELSLHPEIVRQIPQLMHRVQRERKVALRQTILSTHSFDLLRDEGIAADEVLIFNPHHEGSFVRLVQDIEEAKWLLESGATMADIVPAYTRPVDASQLSLF